MKRKQDDQLSYNHFISLKDKFQPKVQLEKEQIVRDPEEPKIIDPVLVNGYDGQTGTH